MGNVNPFSPPEHCCPTCQRPYDSRYGGNNMPMENGLVTAQSYTRITPPSTVGKALREQCSINWECFFLAVYLGGGDVAFFSGPELFPEEEVRKIFRRDRFIQAYNRLCSPTSERSHTIDDDDCSPSYGGEPYTFRNSVDEAMNHHFGPQWPNPTKRRKRRFRRTDEDAEPAVIMKAMRSITIGNSEQVREYYVQRFTCLQQRLCREISKAFVKTIAPKKQANNPYTGGEEKRPDWWPGPWGPGEKERVRHKEPDHLWKKERIVLLTHILSLVTEPRERQHPDIRRVGVDTALLEKSTMDFVSSWFATNGPKNAHKKSILKELFRVAKAEERYKKNEIDGSTQIQVLADDMVMSYCPPEDDENEEDVEEVTTPLNLKGDPDQDHTPLVASCTMPLSKATAPTNSSLPPVSTTSSLSHTISSPLHGQSFLGDMHLRGHQYSSTSPMLATDLSTEQYAYPEPGNLTTVATATAGQPALQPEAPTSLQLQDMVHTHDPNSRRSSVACPAPEFGTSPSALYSPASWQQAQAQPHHHTATAVTSAPGSSGSTSLYYTTAATASQQTLPPPPPPPPPHHHHPNPLPLPHYQQQHLLPNPYASHAAHHQQAQTQAAAQQQQQQQQSQQQQQQTPSTITQYAAAATPTSTSAFESVLAPVHAHSPHSSHSPVHLPAHHHHPHHAHHPSFRGNLTLTMHTRTAPPQHA